MCSILSVMHTVLSSALSLNQVAVHKAAIFYSVIDCICRKRTKNGLKLAAYCHVLMLAIPSGQVAICLTGTAPKQSKTHDYHRLVIGCICLTVMVPKLNE